MSFSYPGAGAPVLTDITLDIPRGSLVALVGKTGSGKTTLADLLMALLEPDEGRISVDGVELTSANRRHWRQSVAHVPQSIFLADASIARNIALVLDDDPIDMDRVIDASTKAQLHEFVTSLNERYDTRVGERGVRLSGGQRQRLGIARAMYKQAPVLVLDEPTSALDSATEEAIIDALQTLKAEGRTIIIISHRSSVIARCDIVIRLHKGRLVELDLANAVAPSAEPAKSSGACTIVAVEPRQFARGDQKHCGDKHCQEDVLESLAILAAPLGPLINPQVACFV